MKSKERAVSPDSRVEYRWAADHDAGFEKSTFIYDDEGRLMAVDYGTRRNAEPTLRAQSRVLGSDPASLLERPS